MNPVRVATVIGARPQFIKASAVSRAIASRNRRSVVEVIAEQIIHTGQHYDDDMSAIFFNELGLAQPDYNLGVGSGSHAYQTGEMLIRLEAALIAARPDVVLVYGDTNSTLAASLAAAKLGLRVAHVEAGARSCRRDMAEEINRLVADRLSSMLFCASEQAVANLRREGITEGVIMVGDVMLDALRWHLGQSPDPAALLAGLGLTAGGYVVATVHRAENTDDGRRLDAIFEALGRVGAGGLPVVVALHPRTRARLGAAPQPAHVQLISPLAYGDMIQLLANARVVVTDSGGVQKEAYWLGIPCVTTREETEWTETVAAGWNTLVGTAPDRIVEAVYARHPVNQRPEVYGSGGAAEAIVEVLASGGLRAGPVD